MKKNNLIKKNVSKPLRVKIRQLSGIEGRDKEYFSREEIISVLKTIEPNLEIVEDKDEDEENFISCGKLFEHYLTQLGIWKEQKTVSNHPRLPNLQAIHKKLAKINIKQQRAIKKSRSIKKNSIIISKDFQDITKIFNSLPSWVEQKANEIIFEGKNNTRIIIGLRRNK